MAPGAVQSFTQAGVPVDSPAAQSVADIAAQQAADQGDFDTPAEDVPDAWYETLWDASTDWAKPIVRTGFTVLATPLEEVQALLSAAGTAFFDETKAGQAGLLSDIPGNVAALVGEVSDPGSLVEDFWENYTEKAARSSGLLALGDLLEGKHVDLGEGFLPGGEIYEQRQRDKHRLTLDGQFVTPGRLWARQVVEPGTGQYQFLSGAVDFTQNIVLDPANIVGFGLAKAAKAQRAFQQVGLIPGVRKSVSVPEAVNHFLTTDDGQQVIRKWTQNRDVAAAFKSIGSPDAGGLGWEAARRLAATTNETETFNVAQDILGTVVRERPSVRFTNRQLGRFGRNEHGLRMGGGARVAQADSSRLGFLARTGRLGENLPSGPVSARNIDNSAIQLDRWMVNAGLPDDTRLKVLDELSGVTGQATFEETIDGAARAVREHLVSEWGIKENRARRLTSLWEDTMDGHRVFDLDDYGNHVDVLAPLRPQIGGQTVDVSPMPAMIAELADDIYLPNVTEIRRLTPTIKAMQSVYDSGLWKGTVDGIRAVQSAAWIPLNLLRNALTVRVVGDSQFRMAGAGYDSVINHPMDSVSWFLGADPNTTRFKRIQEAILSDKNPVKLKPKGTQTISGQQWDDFVWHTNSLERGSAGWRGLPGEILTGNYVQTRYGQPGFYDGWADKLSHMANDPVYKRIAGGLLEGDLRSIGKTSPGNTFDDVAEWFWSGTGQSWRKELGSIEGRSALLNSRPASDEYLKQNFFDQLERVTGGDPDLANLVAKQTLGDVNLRTSGHIRKLSRTLEDAYDHAAPGWMGTPQKVSKGKQNQAAEAFDHLMEVGFEKFLTNPENFLTKSPTMRQMYFDRVEELITTMPRKLQEQAVKGAKAAGMGDDYLAKLASKMLKGEGTTVDSMQKLEMLAGSWAMSETKALLYHMADRNQFFDMMKVVFPFGDVWKNVVTSWGRIVKQNPQVLRRFQQGLEGVRQPSLLGEAETEPGTGEGFFHTDPTTGEEVFTYPGLGSMASKMLGLPEGSVDFVGRASGVNLVAATVLPGFGPAITIPASHLIPNTPSWDGVRETLMPFGETPSVVDALIPPWADKMKEFFSTPDPRQHRMFSNTVSDVMRTLGPQRGIDSRDGQQALLDEATTIAKQLYVIRGIAQFNLPTGPSFQWNVEDVQGNLVPVKLLSEDLRKLTEAYGGDRQAAFQEWVKKYGVENVLSVIGKSTSIVERPVTEKGDAWLRANADLEEAFPTSIGLFAPEPAAGAFDYSAYLRAIENGARETVSPAEQLALANDFLGRIQWENAKQLADANPSPAMSTWLAQVRDQIAEDYPGFDGWVAEAVSGKRPRTEDIITELRRAAENPTLAATDAGQGLQIYLSAIDAAEQMVIRLPGNIKHYQQAKAARPVRDWLRSVSRKIREDHPDFARLWVRVFERELADDEELSA